MCCVGTRSVLCPSLPNQSDGHLSPGHIPRRPSLPEVQPWESKCPHPPSPWAALGNDSCRAHWVLTAKSNDACSAAAHGTQELREPRLPAPPLILPRMNRTFSPAQHLGYSQGRSLHVAHVAAAVRALRADTLEASTGVDARGLPGTQVL